MKKYEMNHCRVVVRGFRFLVAGIIMLCWAGPETAEAAVPALEYPANKGTVYQTVPYFKWNDAVGHPYPGSYKIQIDDSSDFSSPWDDDTIPAILRWYSPTAEMTRGATYYWRVRHIAEDGTQDSWSASGSFTIGTPQYFDVSVSDTYTDIQAKFQMAIDYGNTHAQAGCLRFPAAATLNLLMPADAGPLFDSNGRDNWVIEGRNSKVVIEYPQPSWSTKVHLSSFGGSEHFQISNMQFDYAPNSINHIAGQITEIDHAAGTFRINVDRNVFAMEGFDGASAGIFWNADRTRAITQHAPMANTWGEGKVDDSTYKFKVRRQGNKMTGSQWEFVQVGDWFVSNVRNGDLIDTRDNAHDMVAYNITCWHSRGRFHAGGGVNSYKRFINCQVKRPGGIGRVYTCHSTSQTQGSYFWWEDTHLEYCRDDMMNCGQDGGYHVTDGQYVVRNCYLTGGARHGIAGLPDRSWAAGNTIKDMAGITTWSGGGKMDTGVIEGNLLLTTLPYPATYERIPGINVDAQHAADEPLSHHQYLVIRNNTIQGAGNTPYDFHDMENSTVSSNLVVGDPGLPAADTAFYFDGCRNVKGANNLVDRHIAKIKLLEADSSSNINVQIQKKDVGSSVSELKHR
jgi:hypothetical protein